MRRVITIATVASAMLAMTSVGQAQNNKSQGKAHSEDSFWPSPGQEQAIPYYPCDADVEFRNGRHVCLGGGRRPVAPRRPPQ